MAEALITISISRIQEGRAGDFERINAEIVAAVQEHEPRLIGMHVYLTEDGSRVVGVQVHPDAESMEFHMQVMREKIGRALDMLELTEFLVLGPAGPGLTQMMERLAAGGTTVDHLPRHVSGFTRSRRTG